MYSHKCLVISTSVYPAEWLYFNRQLSQQTVDLTLTRSFSFMYHQVNNSMTILTSIISFTLRIKFVFISLSQMQENKTFTSRYLHSHRSCWTSFINLWSSSSVIAIEIKILWSCRWWPQIFKLHSAVTSVLHFNGWVLIVCPLWVGHSTMWIFLVN